jgi:hypothetical protein
MLLELLHAANMTTAIEIIRFLREVVHQACANRAPKKRSRTVL